MLPPGTVQPLEKAASLSKTTSGIGGLRPLYVACSKNAAKAVSTVYMSSAAQPVNQPDALRLLLDRLHRGADAALIAEGDGARVLLDLVADCLSSRRIRTLWAEAVLPSSPAAPMPDDAALSRSFQALTMLDGTCDRIVLLVGDAGTLSHPALRYIQFASRTAPHLQLVFCGTRAFLDTLNAEEFASLRARLTAGPVLALAAPITEDADTDAPLPAAVSDNPPAWAGKAAPPLPDAWGPAVSSAGKRSRALPLGALALLGLALLGVGGAAGFVLGVRGAPADRPAASQQAASVQPPTLPNASAPGMPGAGAASRADPEPVPAAPDALPPPSPAMAGGAQGAGPGSPPGGQPAPPPAVAPGPVVTVRSQPKAGLPEDPRPSEPPTGVARSLGRPGAAAPSRAAAMAALESRVRRLREARDQAAPPRDDEWASSQPAFGSWTAPESLPPRYIGSYAADANGVRVFHPEP